MPIPSGGGRGIMPRMENRVVVHFRNGRIVKGYTYDFNPNKEIFHIFEAQDAKRVIEVSMSFLKAVFFVRSFKGNKDHPDPGDFPMESFKNSPGLKVKVTFFDDEVMYGSTHGYSPNRRGFFLIPANKYLNNERVFVIRESTIALETWRWQGPYRPPD
jgi:hypothetical protein